MLSLGTSPLQSPTPPQDKVSNGHSIHVFENPAEENKNGTQKYLPVSGPGVYKSLVFEACKKRIYKPCVQFSTCPAEAAGEVSWVRVTEKEGLLFQYILGLLKE